MKKGDDCISVHIPRGTNLSDEVCENSYRMAKDFFKKYFEIGSGAFHCHSWLLHPWISEEMPDTSNLVKFQKKYSLYSISENKEEPLNYVFPDSYKKGDVSCDSYPIKTSLQRVLKYRLDNNLPVGMGKGVRFL